MRIRRCMRRLRLWLSFLGEYIVCLFFSLTSFFLVFFFVLGVITFFYFYFHFCAYFVFELLSCFLFISTLFLFFGCVERRSGKERREKQGEWRTEDISMLLLLSISNIPCIMPVIRILSKHPNHVCVYAHVHAEEKF